MTRWWPILLGCVVTHFGCDSPRGEVVSEEEAMMFRLGTICDRANFALIAHCECPSVDSLIRGGELEISPLDAEIEPQISCPPGKVLVSSSDGQTVVHLSYRSAEFQRECDRRTRR